MKSEGRIDIRGRGKHKSNVMEDRKSEVLKFDMLSPDVGQWKQKGEGKRKRGSRKVNFREIREKRGGKNRRRKNGDIN